MLVIISHKGAVNHHHQERGNRNCTTKQVHEDDVEPKGRRGRPITKRDDEVVLVESGNCNGDGNGNGNQAKAKAKTKAENVNKKKHNN